MKITVYAITKDEEQFVDRWMDSMAEADEVVVLDTGSSDGTVAKLRARGARVEVKTYGRWRTVEEYEALERAGVTPWRFDWARNDSMALASADTDILVCTDLDEVLLPGWRTLLETAWTQARTQGMEPTTAQYEYVWNFNADGSDGKKFLYEKVHAPRAKAVWTHPVHEILTYDVPKVMVPVPGMRLEHHPDPNKSRGQYLAMLEMSVRECPEDDRNMHYLGREYMFRGMWLKSIETLKRHLALKSATWRAERASSMRFIARDLRELGFNHEAAEWLRRAMAEEPGQREAAVDLAQLGYDMQLTGDEAWWEVVVEGAEAACAVVDRAMSYLTDSECWGSKPWDLLCMGYWYTGRKAAARLAAMEALKYEPDNVRLRENARACGCAV